MKSFLRKRKNKQFIKMTYIDSQMKHLVCFLFTAIPVQAIRKSALFLFFIVCKQILNKLSFLEVLFSLLENIMKSNVFNKFDHFLSKGLILMPIK